MPRPAGHIDEKKREAILAAAYELFLERGLKASMVEIARRAGVSKQTLYNRFPTRIDLARALGEQRSDAITEPLKSGAPPQEVLTNIAQTLLTKACVENQGRSLRGVALISPEFPELARTIYEAGPGSSVQRIAAWLKQQDEQGTLSVPDPLSAAEIFAGMVLGHSHLRGVLGLPHPMRQSIEDQAREAALRFIRAYQPAP